jgi:post-segregation antitoxin (ccd killing protein)
MNITVRKNIAYAQVMIAVPMDIKCKAQDLEINLSKSGLAGIKAAIIEAEAKAKRESDWVLGYAPDVKV